MKREPGSGKSKHFPLQEVRAIFFFLNQNSLPKNSQALGYFIFASGKVVLYFFPDLFYNLCVGGTHPNPLNHIIA